MAIGLANCWVVDTAWLVVLDEKGVFDELKETTPMPTFWALVLFMLGLEEDEVLILRCFIC